MESLGVQWKVSEGDGVCVYESEEGVRFLAVPLIFFAEGGELEICAGANYIFEDRWRHSNSLMKAHICANAGLGRSAFARNCTAKSIAAEEAATFLKINHIYGDAKAKYSYGLYRRRRTGAAEMEGEAGELLAVASFSSSREITRDGRLVKSYEWVRYASKAGVRVVGGMGKLLQMFIDEVHPEDIMSYADLEWSDGKVYEKLGFKKIGSREPVSFLVNPDTMERIAEQRIGRDRKYKAESDFSNYFKIKNLGSDKYCLTTV